MPTRVFNTPTWLVTENPQLSKVRVLAHPPQDESMGVPFSLQVSIAVSHFMRQKGKLDFTDKEYPLYRTLRPD